MKILALALLLFLSRQGLSSREKRFIGFPFASGYGSGSGSGEFRDTFISSGDNDGVEIDCGFYNTYIRISYEFLEFDVRIENPHELVFLDEKLKPIDGCSYPVAGSNVSINLEQFAQCSSGVENYFDQLEVQYQICVLPEPPSGSVYWTRDRPTNILLKCIFHRDIVGYQVILPQIKKIVVDDEESSGEFDLKFYRCEDENCTSSDQSSEVYGGDRVYFGVEICVGEYFDMRLQLLDCWATPTPDPDDPRRYDIVANGCDVIDSAYPGSTIIHESFTSYIARFSFSSFTWTSLDASQQFIYLHCYVQFCPACIEECAETSPECGGKKRRALGYSLGTGEPRFTSSDPIKIKQCNKEKLGCAYDCTGSSVDNTESCVCPAHLRLADDMKNCEKPEPKEHQKNIPIELPEPVSYEVESPQTNEDIEEDLSFLAFGIFMGMSLAAGIFYWRIKNKNSHAKCKYVDEPLD